MKIKLKNIYKRIFSLSVYYIIKKLKVVQVQKLKDFMFRFKSISISSNPRVKNERKLRFVMLREMEK